MLETKVNESLRMRSELLGLVSIGLTMAVLGNAWHQRQQFYPSVVYITKSNPSMAIIYLQSLVVVVLIGKIMRKIFFGQLRAAEFEHLMERSWYAVTETCLAFTVFKDDFSPKFVGLFVLLLFLKSFHWLAEERVDFMERSPVISILFHLRVLSLAVFLAALDILFIQHACTNTITKGASVQLVFGFEYAILLTIILNTVIKYILHSVDLHSETPWENKAVFMLYTELFIGFLKVLLYVLFFMIMVRIFTLPLFAVRPMYLTMRAFKKAFNDVVLSRRAIHNMNTLYPDATAQELENTDNVCIICREEMVAPSAKKLPCNHIFHRSCLRSWFQRQQTCPTCRLDVLRTAPAAATVPPNFQQQVAALHQQIAALQQQRTQQQQPQQQPQQQYMPNLLNMMGLPPQALGAGAAGGVGGVPGRPRVLPPFPPFMAWNIPPPMPPPNFQGMSDDELREMEGAERENVEARIRCLRNVQVLLDAAVLEMQQYSAVVARCTAQQNSARASSAAADTSENPLVAATAAANAAAAATASLAADAAAASTSPAAADIKQVPNSHSSNPNKMSSAASVSTTTSSSSDKSAASEALGTALAASNSASPPGSCSSPPGSTEKKGPGSPFDEDNPFNNLTRTPEQDEIRKRRLAVFEEQKKRLMKK
ncbi:E3 ubiquitin-protein ligase synoviolin B isoform X2 [Eurytemora carolleeae]|uniref:E3 ubiquitin-protein ligase synoviolin B isoform X2 n=1 Tax=Eurytemora carolleeae TaxID=1294199 RepID=UPI000C786B21|nr:E3 ubiquitin-protein ligase synoviolin B isoform X2 [Eurytemora carolleeae]|eukprot:XP_023330216.1 E3 ubiquitin-protein ligase synoviolin B-like isoform X2 [Eurytemora affinis]